MRLFFAVDFAAPVKEAIQQAVDGIPLVRPPWRWVATKNLHMTLKFLGDTAPSQLSGLEACATAVCRDVTPFSIRLGGLGGFPKLSRPRVLFYRVEVGAEPLIDLAERLDRRLADQLGIPRERRPFRAHVTVARIKEPLAPEIVRVLESAPPVDAAEQPVDRLILVRSELHREGAKYHHLKEFALAKPR